MFTVMIEILHIDDNASDRDLLCAALGQANPGVIYRGVADPLLAMAELADAERLPALVVVDLALPLSTGAEVLRFLGRHKRLVKVPRAVLTGSLAESDLEECRALGATRVYRKPAHFDGLLLIAGALVRMAQQSIGPGLSRDLEYKPG
jgi:CheY-like chemotaxis protein